LQRKGFPTGQPQPFQGSCSRECSQRARIP